MRIRSDEAQVHPTVRTVRSMEGRTVICKGGGVVHNGSEGGGR